MVFNTSSETLERKNHKNVELWGNAKEEQEQLFAPVQGKSQFNV